MQPPQSYSVVGQRSSGQLTGSPQAPSQTTGVAAARFPLYYELKIAFVIWLLSPYTRGASLLYRKFLHPLLSSREREIDDYIVQARERSYETMGQGALSDRLRSFSMHDLTAIQGDEPMQRPFPDLPDPKKKTKISNFEASDYDYSFNQDTGEEISDKEIEGACSEDEALAQRGVRRSQSVKMTRLRARKDVCSFLI
ncbi:REEP3 protein, partial [Polyodon spathula]|nr:REEP3 protein [Polyodon spathula]